MRADTATFIARFARLHPYRWPTWLQAVRVWLLWVLLPVFLLITAIVLSVPWHPYSVLTADHARLPQPQQWTQQLEGVSYSPDGFDRLAYWPPPPKTVVWRSLTLPTHVRLPIKSVVDNAQVSRLWVRSVYQVPMNHPPEQALVVYGTRLMGGAYTVWVNGQLVFANTEEWRMQWNHPMWVTVPRSLAVPGQNLEIHIGLPFRPAQGYSLGSIYVGTQATLSPAHDWRLFFQRRLPQVGMIVIAVMGLLSLQSWRARRAETPHLVMGATCLTWFVCNLQYFFDFARDDWASVWFGSLVDSAIAWLLLLIAVFVLGQQKRPFKWVQIGLMLYVIGITVITLPWWGWQTQALVLQHTFDVVVFFGICVLLTWVAMLEKRVDIWVLCLAVYAMLGLGAYDLFGLTSQANPDGVHLFPYASIVMFLAFMYTLQRRHIGALLEADALNVSLAARLQTHEEQLRRDQLRLRRAEQQQARHWERERLRLDLHASLANRLGASLRQVQQGGLNRTQLLAELTSCFDETRILIESLEPIDHNIVILLGTMRRRMEPLFKKSNVRLIWRMGDVKPLPWLEAPQCLQALRMVQAALTWLMQAPQAQCITMSAQEITAHAPHPQEPQQATGCLLLSICHHQALHLDPAAALSALLPLATQLGAWAEIHPTPMGGYDIRLHLPYWPHPGHERQAGVQE